MIPILPTTLPNVQKCWEYTHDWRIPLEPKFSIKCPICGGAARFKSHYLHNRVYEVTGQQPRIDMVYKCTNCAYVMTFGVHITEDYYQEISGKVQGVVGRIRTIHILEVIDLERSNDVTKI